MARIVQYGFCRFTVFPETQTEFGSGSNGQYAFWDGADGGISDGDMTWGPRFAGQKIAQWNSPIRNKETGETIPWWGMFPVRFMMTSLSTNRCPSHGPHDNLRDFFTYRNYYKSDFFQWQAKVKKLTIILTVISPISADRFPILPVYTGIEL